MNDQPIELGGAVLEAYRLHIEAVVRAEVEEEMAQADQRRADLLRGYAERNRADPMWTERRDAARAAEEQRQQKVLAARAKKTEESV